LRIQDQQPSAIDDLMRTEDEQPGTRSLLSITVTVTSPVANFGESRARCTCGLARMAFPVRRQDACVCLGDCPVGAGCRWTRCGRKPPCCISNNHRYRALLLGSHRPHSGVVSSLKTHQSTPISEGGLHRARRMPATTREADRLNFALQRFPALPSDTTQRRQCIDKLFATHPQ
jgi:hypothetical protein